MALNMKEALVFDGSKALNTDDELVLVESDSLSCDWASAWFVTSNNGSYFHGAVVEYKNGEDGVPVGVVFTRGGYATVLFEGNSDSPLGGLSAMSYLLDISKINADLVSQGNFSDLEYISELAESENICEEGQISSYIDLDSWYSSFLGKEDFEDILIRLKDLSVFDEMVEVDSPSDGEDGLTEDFDGFSVDPDDYL